MNVFKCVPNARLTSSFLFLFLFVFVQHLSECNKFHSFWIKFNKYIWQWNFRIDACRQVLRWHPLCALLLHFDITYTQTRTHNTKQQPNTDTVSVNSLLSGKLLRPMTISLPIRAIIEQSIIKTTFSMANFIPLLTQKLYFERLAGNSMEFLLAL